MNAELDVISDAIGILDARLYLLNVIGWRNGMNAPTLDEQIACVSREIAIRELVYPKWVEAGKLRKPVADHEIACMKAVLGTLMAARAIAPLAGRP
jgi:hypothetical protein